MFDRNNLSPLRFMLVFGFCFLLYVLRNHLYANRNNNNRNRRNNNNANGNAAAPAANVPAAGAAVVPDPVAPAEAPADAPAEAPGQEEGARVEGPQNEANDDDVPGAAPQPVTM